jgi:hypothetical protein
MPQHFTRVRIGKAPEIAPVRLLWGWECLSRGDKGWRVPLVLPILIRGCWRRPRWVNPAWGLERCQFEKDHRSRRRLRTPREFVDAMFLDSRVPIKQAQIAAEMLLYVDGGRWLEDDDADAERTGE